MPSLAILYPGNRESRALADPQTSRFAAVFKAFAQAGVSAQPAVYHDDFADAVRDQLLTVDGVLVWHNPIEGGRDRTGLDALLRFVAAQGTWVSAHPDVILALGTKDVLLSVRDTPFGSDAHKIDSLQSLRVELPGRLRLGARVLKQHRGHSGIGIWRVEQVDEQRYQLRHAQRGSPTEVVDFGTVADTMAPYFAGAGHMIDQAWQERLPEGMIRAYLVGDRAAGFGHQQIVALHPAPLGGIAPEPCPRLYSGPDDTRFQALRHLLESQWIETLIQTTGLERRQLPVLWDADFLLGPRDQNGKDTYVLCEVNVSSVSPFPETAVGPLVQATLAVLAERARM